MNYPFWTHILQMATIWITGITLGIVIGRKTIHVQIPRKVLRKKYR